MKIFCNKNNKLFIIFCGQGRNRTYIYVISDNYNEKFCCCKKLYVSKNQYFNLSKLVAGVGIEPTLIYLMRITEKFCYCKKQIVSNITNISTPQKV